jgi:hypothetical protein
VEAGIEVEAFRKTHEVALADTNQDCLGDSSEVHEPGEGLGTAPLIAKAIRGEAPSDRKPYRATEAYPSMRATQADVRPTGFQSREGVRLHVPTLSPRVRGTRHRGR